jgi:hypothetical protein
MAEIGCSTCHLTHGRAPSYPLPPGATDAQVRTGWKLMLRDDIDQKLCATCHGADAPRMLLYFHRPRLLGSRHIVQAP